MVFSISFTKILKYINLPLLSSISIHALFFILIFPNWNPRENLSKNNELQNTPVIELNQLEQTRIPSQNPNNTFNWNILNGLPEDNNQNLAFNIPNNSLPEVNLSPLPFPSGTNGNLPSLPPLPPPTFFDNSNPSTLPLPNYQLDSSTSTQLPPSPYIDQNLNQDIISSLPDLQDSDLLNGNQQITTHIEITPEVEAQIRQKLFGDSSVQITANPRDIINNRNTSPNLDNINKKNTSHKPAIVNPLPKNHQSLTNQLQKNSTNTSDEEARKNYVSWATEVKSVKSKKLSLQGIYPKDACIRKLEGTTSYGITVNPQGNIVNSKLIKSSGYNIFNNQALTQIKNHKFVNDTQSNQPYHIYVNFKYDNKVCPSISVNSIGNIPAPKSTNKTIPSSPKPNSSTDKSSNQAPNNNNQEIVSPPNIDLPNTSNNKANMLSIPTSSSETRKDERKSSSPSSQTPAQSLSPELTEQNLDELRLEE